MKLILSGLFVTISAMVFTFIILHRGDEKGQQYVTAHQASVKQIEEAWLKIQAAEPALAADYLETTSESARIEKGMDDLKLFMDIASKVFFVLSITIIILTVCAIDKLSKPIRKSEELPSDA